MKFTVHYHQLYEFWLDTQTEKSKAQIEKRLDMIRLDGHFGHIRNLGDDLHEIKFNDGRRIYYTIIPINNVILILGGSKNGQDSDIRKAKNSLKHAKEKAKSRIKT